METQDRAEDHYKQVGSTEATTNTQLSFVLTTMENAYSGTTGSIRNRYSLSDIQTAHWKVADLDGIIPNGNHLTSNGLTLYNKALSYQSSWIHILMAVDIKHRFMVLRVIHILLEQKQENKTKKILTVLQKTLKQKHR